MIGSLEFGRCSVSSILSNMGGLYQSAAITTCRHIVRNSDVLTSRVRRSKATSTNDVIT